MNQELSPEQSAYIRKLAQRYVYYRKSAAIDAQDLMSAATLRWWQFCQRNPDLQDERVIQICFYQQVKGAMRDVIRDSSPVKVTRTMQAQMKAYQRPYTVELDHVIDIQAGEEHADYELWMDVVASLKKLPEREQLILSLYFERDFSFTEIAEILEVSVSTVTRAYRKALDAIKKDLAEPNLYAKNQSR
ncbi:sigma-70 family RNA polymerase sigma factor [Alicyclobacillus cycloheptanicus]|uniref:RNA polymerase sigma factor (Sigma-70 family) n=1 Tax=Alicyclobacillus cycloheptanicus TaxID=1457 RepID=A0ABT9XK27_9BACL|nr:sigma-70 family RNA polymerase sigma factor [Alicyclobacillus cycloheptanicus]MDQ0190662.1 RNA polymerase sigma factor (sigma-70 family) [Alicyclobacillus cycloheptanicus]WDM00320.1 sigma-70 family RNA polymerase sigma factor [Alicyclobacillus cycloheptanicus]